MTCCVEATARIAMTSKSTKPRGALLTIVSLVDSSIRVKRFYERGVRNEKRRMGGMCEGLVGLRFPYAED